MLTKANERNLPSCEYRGGKGMDAVVYVKFFTPDSNWTWYATEYDPSTGTFFGLVCGMETELGYFSLHELKTAGGPRGMRIERDIHFKPQTLNECQRFAA